MRAELKAHEVMLIGAGLDEAPMAYKNIRQVMAAQTELVDTLATFQPRMVRMADDGSRFIPSIAQQVDILSNIF